ncbi:hypothetical protein BASA81_004505 [Batrachochytrium salamandrivorans]|nr:hypothetical protein BASA81_004505 [Batrachochytrium salamandrivorans]
MIATVMAARTQNPMSPPKPFASMPTMTARARPRSPEESNPFMITHLAHEGMETPVFNLITIDADKSPVGNVMLNDEQECKRILVNSEGIWQKGPQTYEPFLSLVPKHLIGLEGPYHEFLREKAQDALAEALLNGRVPGERVANKLVNAIHKAIANPQTTSWIGKPAKFENREPCLVITEFQRVIRSAALELVTETLFNHSWNVIDDYTAKNDKAYTLQLLMSELHYRVTDLTRRSWRRNHREEPVGSLQDKLDLFILSEIDASSARSQGPETCMLDSWTRDVSLSREEIRNLCMTFLTMGSENVSTGLAWLGVYLSESPEDWQVKVRTNREDRIQAFHDAMRLSPSVAVLTRTNTRDTVLCGYELPRFTEVIVNMYSVHRNEQTWGANSGAFCPFAREVPLSTTEGPPFAFPFGGGKRNCIGRPLTMHELDTIFTKLVQNFRLIAVQDEGNGVVVRNPHAETQPNSFISLRPGSHQIALVPLKPASKI